MFTNFFPLGRGLHIPMGGRKGGGAAPFSPSDISGLKLWLKADAITGLNDGDAVTTWSDSSGEGDDATQSTAGQKPIYKTAIQNGLAVVRFDGSNDVMAATLGADIAQPITAYIVAKLTTASGQRRLLDSPNRMLFDANFGAAAGSQYSFYVNGAAGSDNADGTADTSIHLFTIIWNGASSNFWIDAALATTSYDMGTTNSGTTIYVGAEDAAGNRSIAGDYHELLLYSGAHDSTQRGNVETYLNNKWAV